LSKNFYKVLKGISLLFALVILINGCYKEEIIEITEIDRVGESFLQFNQVDAFLDQTNKFFLHTIGADSISDFITEIHFNDYTSVQLNGEYLINDHVNNIGDIAINTPYELVAKYEKIADTFNLIFTRLPLLHVFTDNEIMDEPKSFARIFLQYCDEDGADENNHLLYTYGGIEIRGATSAKYDKTSFGLELWRNKIGDDYSASLLGMHIGEDWILDAMYIDNLRMRNKISFELWEKMSSVPVQDNKPNVVPGIHSEYVELFINNSYAGLYTLSEKLDENLLHYSNNQYELGGVLYKAIEWGDGATAFNTLNSDAPNDVYWDGWEQIYPKSSYEWGPLEDLREVIVNNDNDEFEEEIGSLIDIGNAVDYYIFLNMTMAFDNAGKNTYLVRYTDQSQFFFIPWDIEATWGLFWNRSKSDPDGIVSNHLFERLLSTNAENFNDQIEARWTEYRHGIFDEDSLIQPIIEYYEIMKNSGVISRENTRWGEANIDLDLEYEYISKWILGRIEYLDAYFNQD
jgi:spore coat protein H